MSDAIRPDEITDAESVAAEFGRLRPFIYGNLPGFGEAFDRLAARCIALAEMMAAEWQCRLENVGGLVDAAQVHVQSDRLREWACGHAGPAEAWQRKAQKIAPKCNRPHGHADAHRRYDADDSILAEWSS
jgi:hypothetical protein